MQKIAIYPGSFDPVTNGHLDIIQRSSKVFDKLIVAILDNPMKNSLFSKEDRILMLQESTIGFENVEIDSFSGLLTHYMSTKNAKIIIKGLRGTSDFEYEYQMAVLNNKLDSQVETMFMMTNNYSYLSSSAVKQIVQFGGSIKGLVPDVILTKVISKFMESGGVR